MMPGVPAEAESLHCLMDEYRVRCLWFLREGYYPVTIAEAWCVLDAIQRCVWIPRATGKRRDGR